jgi:hypothetical protein
MPLIRVKVPPDTCLSSTSCFPRRKTFQLAKYSLFKRLLAVTPQGKLKVLMNPLLEGLHVSLF